MRNEKHTCCLCGKKFSGLGNNAQPLAKGTCCDECNNIVIIARSVGLTKSDETPFVGAIVAIVEMLGKPRYSGRYGKIEHIDDMGQLHGTWGGYALIPNQDKFIILKERNK